MTDIHKTRSNFGRWARAGVAAVALAGATAATVEPASAFGPRFFPGGGGGFHGGGFRGGGFHGGYGGFRGGYGGWHRGGGWGGRGIGFGLAGLGTGLLLGSAIGGYGGYGGYGYGGYPYGGGYYGAGYGGYGGYDGCLRRVWGPYGPHWVNVCY